MNLDALQILTGDCRAILPTLEAESVQCCVTSPPYWGLRDYGTAQWEGGDQGCDHKAPSRFDYALNAALGRTGVQDQASNVGSGSVQQYRNLCTKCGARRIDSQLGLEATPEEYIANMVAVFREVWRVLRDDGTLWLNMGDSYASPIGGNNIGLRTSEFGAGNEKGKKVDELESTRRASSVRKKIIGLKPKDLCMMPARVALALQADGWYLRSDIIWAKPNPMPESVTDRPTKAHEYIFLLTKQERYFYDAEAIRENSIDAGRRVVLGEKSLSKGQSNGSGIPKSGNALCDFVDVKEFRNKRSVWTIAEPEHVAKCPIDPAIVAALQADGWEIRVEPKPETVDQPTRSHEYIFLLTKSAKYFYDAEAIREPQIEPWRSNGKSENGERNNQGWDGSGFKMDTRSYHPNGRNKRTVWTIATQPYAEAHFATFPEEIPKLCILAGSKPGDVVLDPFMGSGTTLKVAIELGRKAIGIELNADYIGMAKQRCNVTPGLPLSLNSPFAYDNSDRDQLNSRENWLPLELENLGTDIST